MWTAATCKFVSTNKEMGKRYWKNIWFTYQCKKAKYQNARTHTKYSEPSARKEKLG